MENPPELSLPKWGKAFESNVNSLFEVNEGVLELRSKLAEGELGASWHDNVIVENDYADEELTTTHGRVITRTNSNLDSGSLIHNLVQGAIIAEYREYESQPYPRLLIINNRFINDRNGTTHMFQSRVIKINEFNKMTSENYRCFRGATFRFDNYIYGDYGAYYDHEASRNGVVRINSRHSLFESSDFVNRLGHETELLPNPAKQEKILKLARMMIRSFDFGLINPNL